MNGSGGAQPHLTSDGEAAAVSTVFKNKHARLDDKCNSTIFVRNGL